MTPGEAQAGGEYRPIRHPSDAEHNAAVTLQRLGFQDAQVTRYASDGGVDVRGAEVVAQVKAETAPVGLIAVQALFGCAAAESRKGAFFSLSGFTPNALSWAGMAGLALFGFDLMGAPAAINEAALELSSVRRYVDFATAVEHLPAQLLARRDELEAGWHMSLKGPEPVCLLGVLSRAEEAEHWARGLGAMIASSRSNESRVVSGEALKVAGDMAETLSSLDDNDTIAIERLDLASPAAIRLLATAVNDSRVDIKLGKGLSAVVIPMELPSFSLVATSSREWAGRHAPSNAGLHAARMVQLPMMRAFVSPPGDGPELPSGDRGRLTGRPHER